MAQADGLRLPSNMNPDAEPPRFLGETRAEEFRHLFLEIFRLNSLEGHLRSRCHILILSFFYVPRNCSNRREGNHMDLQEQRITCLRMAVDMGCQADSVFTLANNLMGFVTSGAVPSAVASPPVAASVDHTAATGTALPLSEVAPGPGPAPEPTPTTVEAVSGPVPEPAPSSGEAAAVPPAEAASVPTVAAAAAVEAAKAVDVPAAAEAGEAVSAAIVAAPAGGAESAAQSETSSARAADPAIAASAMAEAADSAPTSPAPLAEPIVAEQSAASAVTAESTTLAGDAPTQGASTEVPPPKTNGASTADAASAPAAS